MRAYVKLPLGIARQKGLASREIVGEVIRYTEKGIRIKGHAVIEGSDNCRRCGRRITNPASLLVGYGPECSEHLGIPRDFDPAILEQVKAEAQRKTTIEDWFPRRYATDEDGLTWLPSEPDYSPEAPPVEEKSGEVEVTEGIAEKYWVRFEYNPALVETIKLVPGRRWDKPRKVWQVPYESGPELARILRQRTGHAPAIIMDVYNRWRASLNVTLEKSQATDANIKVEGLAGTLKPFQKAGVAYALDHERVIIGDEMGLGKTIQAIATVHKAQSLPAIIVCPASMKLTWEREIRKWVPSAKVTQVSGTQATAGHIPHAQWLVINYDILTHRLEELQHRGPKAIVFDEMHYLKNDKTQRGDAALDLAKGVRYVLGLTGTAVVNRPSELIHPLRILDRLHQFGGFWGFAKRYCGAYKGRFGLDLSGAYNLEELNTKLRATCYIRREKSQVLKELPAKTRSIVPLDITNRAEYERAEADILKYVEELAWLDDSLLEEVANLDDELLKDNAIRCLVQEKVRRAEKAEHLVKFSHLRALAVRGKLKAAIKWIEDVVEEGQKIVVFAVHQHTVRAIADHFKAPYINGGVSIAKRQAAVDRFQTDPTCRVIVLNIQAGGVGLTLTAASQVAFVEMGWTPGEHQQAEDRCHRIGQQDNVTAWYLVAPETVDEDLANILDTKMHVTDMVNKGFSDGPQSKKGIMAQLRARMEARHGA